MGFTEWFSSEIAAGDRDGLRRQLLADNVRRGRILALIVIAFEACFAAMDVGAAVLRVDSRFHFSLYLVLYLVMMGANIAAWFFLGRYKDFQMLPTVRIARLERFILAYITLMMCWGSAVSLLDQRLYGHLMAFMVNMMTCSVIYSLDTRKMLVPFAASTAALAAGLPFFQPSSDVLVGHYVNLGVFVTMSWLASRIAYSRYCKDYESAMLLRRANIRLETEIERNRQMNLMLTDANQQLTKLSMLDELTGLPNRRSFRHFIDRMLDNPAAVGMPFSVLMADVDHFKQYNDTYGHVMGDAALVSIAAQMQTAVQHSMDIASRWGGEEFLYAAFGVGEPEIGAVAEALRDSVNRLNISHAYSPTGVLTLSIGCNTVVMRDKSDISRAIDRADDALYRAKAAGRNAIRN